MLAGCHCGFHHHTLELWESTSGALWVLNHLCMLGSSSHIGVFLRLPSCPPASNQRNGSLSENDPWAQDSGGSSKNVSVETFHLLKMLKQQLFVLTGIYHYWNCVIIFSRRGLINIPGPNMTMGNFSHLVVQLIFWVVLF